MIYRLTGKRFRVSRRARVDTILIRCFLIGVTALRFEKMSWAFHDGLGEADAPFPEIAFEVRSHRRKVRTHGEVKPQRGLR
jgi:hypothetical protein